jgi:hypothetical protein
MTLPTDRPTPMIERDRDVEQGRRGAWARARQVAVELTPAAIEQVAHRVAELLRYGQWPADETDAPPRLVDAAELARLLGVSRQWVYEHANELGAVTLGTGARPRLRFDPAHAASVLEGRRRGETCRVQTPAPQPRVGRPRRRPSPVPLLPVEPPRASGRRILARARSILARRGGS